MLNVNITRFNHYSDALAFAVKYCTSEFLDCDRTETPILYIIEYGNYPKFAVCTDAMLRPGETLRAQITNGQIKKV